MTTKRTRKTVTEEEAQPTVLNVDEEVSGEEETPQEPETQPEETPEVTPEETQPEEIEQEPTPEPEPEPQPEEPQPEPEPVTPEPEPQPEPETKPEEGSNVVEVIVKEEPPTANIFVYIGPNLRTGLLRKNQIFKGGKPQIPGVTDVYPMINELFVPVEDRLEATRQVVKKGTLLYLAYESVKGV